MDDGHKADIRLKVEAWLDRSDIVAACRAGGLVDVDAMLGKKTQTQACLSGADLDAVNRVVDEMRATDAIENSNNDIQSSDVKASKLADAIFESIIDNFEKYSK